jgi:hypothetical protein
MQRHTPSGWRRQQPLTWSASAKWAGSAGPDRVEAANRVPGVRFDMLSPCVRASEHEPTVGLLEAVSSGLFPLQHGRSTCFARRSPPAGQHKFVSCSDLADVALIDTAGKELGLRRENCGILLFGAGTSSFRLPSRTPPRPRATLPRLKRHLGCTTCFPRIRHQLAQMARSGRAEP